MKTKTLFRFAFILMSFALLLHTAEAQRPGDRLPARERIETARIAFFTRHMKLSPEESKLFWPVYDQYEENLQALRQQRTDELFNMEADFSRMTDKEINELIDSRLAQAEQAILLRKKLVQELRQIMLPRKIALFLRAEQQFNLELQRRLAERKN